MTTYLIRRLIQGFIVLVAASFVIYSILIITPGGPRDQINQILQDPSKHISKIFKDQMYKRYKLDKPYPLNYVIWLFDPSEITDTVGLNTVVPKGIDVTIGPWQIRGSGVLTGVGLDKAGVEDSITKTLTRIAEAIEDEQQP